MAGQTEPRLRRTNLGFLLAKATQQWNLLLSQRFRAEGFAEIRPSYGSLLVPLFEEDGLRMGQLARRARLSKQTLTTLVRLLERDGLVRRERDPEDGRAYRISLTGRARRFEPIAERVLQELDEAVLATLGRSRKHDLESSLAELLELELYRGRGDGSS